MRRHPGIVKARLVVSRSNERDVMTLVCGGDGIDAGAVAETLKTVCNISGRVEIRSLEALPNDGKVIDDTRSVE